MNTVADILDLFDAKALATHLGLKAGAISAMKSRNSIAGQYWLGIVDFARAQGRPEITLGLLARVAAARRETGSDVSRETDTSSDWPQGPGAEPPCTSADPARGQTSPKLKTEREAAE